MGAAFIKLAETWLPELEKVATVYFPNAEIVHRMASRWVLYWGILFILVVFFFPRGFVGTFRDAVKRRKVAAAVKSGDRGKDHA